MTETFTAACDRIVDGETAVLLLERDGEVVDELAVDAGELPTEGRHEGAIFEVTVEDGTPLEVTYRPQRTRERREAIQDRVDRLSERLSEE